MAENTPLGIEIRTESPALQPGWRQCDCLDHCGDDPALRDGRADPCQHYRDRARREAEAVDMHRLQHELARHGALQQLERCVPCEVSVIEGWAWIDVRHTLGLQAGTLPADQAARVRNAARYLVHIGEAVQHPTLPHLVRLAWQPRREG